MAADEDKIKYSDIIQPDDSIEKLVKQLSELNQSYETMVNAIRAGADRIVYALKTASGATNEGRKSIDEAAASTSRLERAQKELKIAMSDTGKQIAWLKAQTVDQNKATVEQQRYLRQAASSYDRLKSDLKQSISLYKSLTEAEREDSAMGQQLLQDIINLKNQVKALDDQLKPHIQTLTEVQKAEQKLAYLQSEEGQKLLDLKAKIAEVTAARKQQKTTTDPLIQAQEKLAYARSEENQQLKLYSTQIKEANQIAKLQAIIADSAEGSYNRLSAQYALNKIKLNQMSSAEREAADSGKKLEAETNAIYQQMIKLQEATGNYRLSVGHYQKTWDGLGISISQLVRELPAAAVSLNTFFLGISNNIPMIVDEINRLKRQNKLLIEEGKETINVTKQVVKAFLSWNTVLVVGLTILSMYGKQISEFIKSLFTANRTFLTTKKAIANVNEELIKNGSAFGSNLTKFKDFQKQYSELKTLSERTKFVEDYKTEFNNLGVAINNVNDAERIFKDSTNDVVEGFKYRAKAAAAQKVASEKYEAALKKEVEAENARAKVSDSMISFANQQKENTQTPLYSAETAESVNFVTGIINAYVKEYEVLQQQAKSLNKEADKYFELYERYGKKADDLLGSIIKNTKEGKEGKKHLRDLTDIIFRNNITIRKKYEESLTKLLNDEFAARRKSAADQIQNENDKLMEMYRKNKEYIANVDGKYKELTESQKQMIDQQQNWIKQTVNNNLKWLSLQLEKITNEQMVNTERIMRNRANILQNLKKAFAPATDDFTGQTQITNFTITSDPKSIEVSLMRERELMLKNAELEYNLELETNEKLLEANDKNARSVEELTTKYLQKRIELIAKYDTIMLNMHSVSIENDIALVKKGSEEELNLKKKQLEIERQLEHTKNAAKPAEEQVSSEVINAIYDDKLKQLIDNFRYEEIIAWQEYDEEVFKNLDRSERQKTLFALKQEKERISKQIKMAKEGSLKWSDVEIATAEATVNGINNKISKLEGINGILLSISEHGFAGPLLDTLGFNDEAMSQFSNYTNQILDQLSSIMDAEIELAQAALDAANTRVEAAKSAYEGEVDARRNGYAASVVAAKAELELEKRNQLKKQKLLEQTQRQKEAVDTASQVSSLITASAALWSSFSGVPIVGPILAAAAIAAMFASFTVAKVKAKQAASKSEQYGEGGIEFLEGGSHASGNDIDLHTTNKKGKNMRAEGGEALAIINKKQTKKYRHILPDVIDSFNKGIFEQKYLSAFNINGLPIFVSNKDNIDLSLIEASLKNIIELNSNKVYIEPNGTVIMQNGNVKRIIRNN